MKTTQVFFVFIISLLFVGTVNAQTIQNKEGTNQESTLIRARNSIELIGSSEARELQVEIAEDNCQFSLDIDAEIEKGSIKIEIYDPKGKKKGVFLTGTTADNEVLISAKTAEKDTKRSNCIERVNGRIMQQNASSGVWLIKIQPKNAHGRLAFNNQQISNTKN